MKLTVDPMPAARAAAKIRVNSAFASYQRETAHTDIVYAQKRLWASSDRGKLRPEAEFRGVTVDELAESILSKPDLLSEREMERQLFMKLIDEAKTPDDLTPEKLSERKGMAR